MTLAELSLNMNMKIFTLSWILKACPHQETLLNTFSANWYDVSLIASDSEGLSSCYSYSKYLSTLNYLKAVKPTTIISVVAVVFFFLSHWRFLCSEELHIVVKVSNKKIQLEDSFHTVFPVQTSVLCCHQDARACWGFKTA